MANSTEKIADRFTKHNIDLVRVEAGLRKRVLAMLNGLGVEIKKAIQQIDPSSPKRAVYRDARFNTLIAFTDDKVAQLYKTVSKELEEELKNLAGIELTSAADITNKVITVNLLQPNVSRNVLKALVDDTLIEGAPSKDWWRTQSRNTQELFKRELREGFIAGETIPAMTERVLGITTPRGLQGGAMKTAKRRAEALVRTSVVAVANQARYTLYQENDDVLKGMQWLATLDSRTSQICISLDGSAWDLDGKPLAETGTTTTFVRPPPIHFNCRSVLIPIIKSWSELNNNPAIADKLAAAENIIPLPVRASMDGEVAGTLNYEEWLKRKDAKGSSLPKKVLGETKYKLWKAGKLNFKDLIDQSWNPLTVAELQAKVQRRAGI